MGRILMTPASFLSGDSLKRASRHFREGLDSCRMVRLSWIMTMTSDRKSRECSLRA